MSFTARSLAFLGVAAALFWGESHVFADEPTAAETRGKALFDEGRKAMEAKDYDAACSKFEASYVVSGVPGSLLNWAECEEVRGRIGTALALWKQGAAKVTREPEREEFVRQRIAALEPRAPKLTITVGTPNLAGVVVTVDARAVADLDVPVVTDPGHRKVVARASGVAEQAYDVDLAIGDAKALVVLRDVVPTLVTLPRTTKAATTATDEGGDGTGLIIGGVVAGALGLGGMIGFAVTSALVVSECGEQLDPCEGDPSKVEGLNIANGVLLGVGAAGLLTGTVLIVIGATQGGDEGAGPKITLAPLPGGAFGGFSTHF